MLAGRSDFVEWNRVTGIEFAVHVAFYTTWKRKKRESTQRESAAATAQGCRIDNAHNNFPTLEIEFRVMIQEMRFDLDSLD